MIVAGKHSVGLYGIGNCGVVLGSDCVFLWSVMLSMGGIAWNCRARIALHCILGMDLLTFPSKFGIVDTQSERFLTRVFYHYRPLHLRLHPFPSSHHAFCKSPA